MIFLLWNVAAVLAAIFCIFRATEDFRRRKYVWGTLGLISALVFLLAPVQHAPVSVTIPIAS